MLKNAFWVLTSYFKNWRLGCHMTTHEAAFKLPLLPEVKVMFSPLCLFFLFVCRISQNVVDGFGRNLVDRLGVSQGRIDSILVKIRIRIWIR